MMIQITTPKQSAHLFLEPVLSISIICPLKKLNSAADDGQYKLAASYMVHSVSLFSHFDIHDKKSHVSLSFSPSFRFE